MTRPYNKKDPMADCANPACDRIVGRIASGKGYCSRCYQRLRVNGTLEPKIAAKGTGHLNKKTGYVEAYYPTTGQKTYEHILIAERALGKQLPNGAVVHYVTENRSDNKGPFKLVICPDQAYHFLIHRLMREKGISFKTGWPNEEADD